MPPDRLGRTVFTLAAAQLRHEWVLTLCLIAALAAVGAPLLVMLGLKEGTVATLRERLVEDPVYREIRPAQTQAFAPDWFASLNAAPETAFLIPTILPASSALYLQSASGEELLDLIPTGPTDPLLLENGGQIPTDGHCVLSLEAARLLGVQAGDRVQARVTRSRNGRQEEVLAELTVQAVLTARAGTLARVYTPLDFVVDVEAYKEGRAVPARGWAGETARPYLSYDGVVVVTDAALDPVTLTGLPVNTGLARALPLTADEYTARSGLTLPGGRFAYELSVPNGTVNPASVQAVARKLRGRQAVVLPYAADLRLNVAGLGVVPVRGLSLRAAEAELLGVPLPPWGAWAANDLDAQRLRQIWLPTATDSPEPLAAQTVDGRALAFPLQPVAGNPAAVPLLPAELVGLLRTARERAIGYTAEAGFTLERAGFRGFRLYARSIDDVPTLVARLQAEGVPVLAEVEAIERIRTLDQGLTRLFWLVALLGVVGAGAVLIASLYAAVERERRGLGVLRLLGLARTDVFWFPVWQGLLIALGGFALGLAAYALLAAVINEVFGQELAPGEAICRLPVAYPPVALLLTLLLAAASSLIAAWKTTRIEPAEAIREE